MKTTIQCPHCDHQVTLHAPLAKIGAVLGAVVGATSRRGLGVRGLVRGAALGGAVAYALGRVLTPRCPGCSHEVPVPRE